MNRVLLTTKVIYGSITFVLNFCIGLLTVNTYAPLTEGWWHVYARWIDQGRVPYKDFELLVTPGFPYITWFFKHLVGEEFLHLRVVGLVFQAGIALLLFLVLSKHVSRLTSAGLATLGTTLLYSGTATISFDYNYFAVFFAILSVYFLQQDYSKKDIYLYLSGLSVAGVFLIKQSTGLCLVFFILLIPFFDRSFMGFTKVRLWLKFIVGFLIPLTLVSIALIIHGAFMQMVESVFINSSGVKGGLATVLTQWIKGIYEPFSFGYATRHIFVLVILVFIFMQIAKGKNTPFSFNKIIVAFMLIVGLFIAGETVRSRFSSSENVFKNFLEDVYTRVSPYIYLEPLLLILLILFWVQRNRKYEWLPVLMLALSITYSTGMSAGLTEYGIFVNILVVGAWLDHYLNLKILSYLMVIFSLLVSASMVLKKFETPYSWWGYEISPIYQNSFKSHTGLTTGLHYDEIQMRNFLNIKEITESVNRCNDEVLTFPNIPYFNLELNSLPVARSAVFWFDFSTQNTINAYLNQNKVNPGIILYIEYPRDVFDMHKNLFNLGKISAQEKVLEYIQSISSEYRWSMYNINSSSSDPLILHLGILECEDS